LCHSQLAIRRELDVVLIFKAISRQKASNLPPHGDIINVAPGWRAYDGLIEAKFVGHQAALILNMLPWFHHDCDYGNLPNPTTLPERPLISTDDGTYYLTNTALHAVTLYSARRSGSSRIRMPVRPRG
jgi:hypothetical protein